MSQGNLKISIKTALNGRTVSEVLLNGQPIRVRGLKIGLGSDELAPMVVLRIVPDSLDLEVEAPAAEVQIENDLAANDCLPTDKDKAAVRADWRARREARNQEAIAADHLMPMKVVHHEIEPPPQEVVDHAERNAAG